MQTFPMLIVILIAYTIYIINENSSIESFTLDTNCLKWKLSIVEIHTRKCVLNVKEKKNTFNLFNRQDFTMFHIHPFFAAKSCVHPWEIKSHWKFNFQSKVRLNPIRFCQTFLIKVCMYVYIYIFFCIKMLKEEKEKKEMYI